MGMMNRSLLKKISILFLLLSISPLFLSVQGRPQTPTEYQVKAAFIYNFAKFVEWPAEAVKPGAPFVIGILGDDPFGSLIDQAVSGKSIRDKRIAVRRFSNAEEAVDAQILFISASERRRLDQILKRLGRAPVLTVGDVRPFAEEGGMVELQMEFNRVRFAINLAAVERAGLKPSSQLLKLARIVGGPAQMME